MQSQISLARNSPATANKIKANMNPAHRGSDFSFSYRPARSGTLHKSVSVKILLAAAIPAQDRDIVDTVLILGILLDCLIRYFFDW